MFKSLIFAKDHFVGTVFAQCADSLLIGCAENDGDEITVAVSLELSALCEKLRALYRKACRYWFRHKPIYLCSF